jgi:XTP/dITP diphosphohydrolase/tetrapyrrole methylase family protein/MazG family protein
MCRSISLLDGFFMPTDKIYDDAFAESRDRLAAYADLVAIVKQLRRDCPWDRAQTHESVKHLLIEEAYEVVEAIDEKDWDALKNELGDILLHVLFHSNIAEENETFTLKDVIEAETEKLVRRHPHVFGDAAADDAASVEANWEQIKMQERDGEDEAPSSVLDGVPQQLPALLRAHRMQEKAAGVGFDFPDRDGAWAKVEEEIQEFHEHAEAGASDSEKEDEFGDVLFALVNYARRVGINPENALRRTNDKFVRRFRHIEHRLAESNRTVADVDLAEADALWEEAKELEAGKR